MPPLSREIVPLLTFVILQSDVEYVVEEKGEKERKDQEDQEEKKDQEDQEGLQEEFVEIKTVLGNWHLNTDILIT